MMQLLLGGGLMALPMTSPSMAGLLLCPIVQGLLSSAACLICPAVRPPGCQRCVVLGMPVLPQGPPGCQRCIVLGLPVLPQVRVPHVPRGMLMWSIMCSSTVRHGPGPAGAPWG